MITNYYTLYHVIAEINQEFSNRSIHEIFTQHRGELVISFLNTTSVIIVGCEPSNNFIYAQTSFARARRNSKNVFTPVIGKVIDKVFLHPSDREITVHSFDGFSIVIQLFGSKANVFLHDALGSTIETFLKKDGQKSIEIHPELTFDIWRTRDRSQSLKTVLKQSFPHYGPVLLQELLFRSKLNGDQPLNDFADERIESLLDTAKTLNRLLLSPPSPYIYYKGRFPVRLSIIPLQSMTEFQFRNFQSVSDAIQVYRAALYHEKEILRGKDRIIKTLEREMEHIKHTLSKIEKELESPDRSKQYEKYGKLLMSHLHLVNKGESTAILEDILEDTHNLIEIPLDIHLTPAKNAERYFEKVKKSRHTVEEQRLRIWELTKQQTKVTSLLRQMEDVVTFEDLKIFLGENQGLLGQYGLKAEKTGRVEKDNPLPFRIFIIAGGFQVWAGKSGENNDLLSTRHTAKSDLWFHARGVGGSHVVLKRGTGKGEISRVVIEEAAAIAAFYSKMKNSKFVPVTMCEGKYVRKQKGSPPGTVTVEREKTIFVEPRLPQRGSV